MEPRPFTIAVPDGDYAALGRLTQALGPGTRLHTTLIDPDTGKASGGHLEAGEVPGLLWLRSTLPAHHLPALLEAFPALPWVHYDLVGVDRLPLELFGKPGAPVLTKAHGIYAPAMAATVVAAVTGHLRGLADYRDATALGTWDTDARTQAVDGAKVAFLGTGQVATLAARALATLGARCIGIGSGRRAARTRLWQACGGYGDLTDLAAGADALVIACPATEATADLVDAAVLRALSPGALVVNVGRGAVLVEDDLVEQLGTGQIGAAVLDAFRTEPLPAVSPLWADPRVTVIPHRSWYAAGRTTSGQVELLAKLIGFCQVGRAFPRRYVVDPEAGY